VSQQPLLHRPTSNQKTNHNHFVFRLDRFSSVQHKRMRELVDAVSQQTAQECAHSRGADARMELRELGLAWIQLLFGGRSFDLVLVQHSVGHVGNAKAVQSTQAFETIPAKESGRSHHVVLESSSSPSFNCIAVHLITSLIIRPSQNLLLPFRRSIHH
jgi:hypothetical protein